MKYPINKSGLLMIILLVLSCSKTNHIAENTAIDDIEFVYGAEANQTGEPIAGGKGYSKNKTSGDYFASTKDELLSALSIAQAGETIIIKPGTQIDLSGQTNIRIPTGVTLAGNRGENEAAGPLLFTNSMPANGVLFQLLGDVRVSGLRIRGPSSSFSMIAPSDQSLSLIAITANEPNIEIDNCEISHFDRGGIEIYPDGENIHIHHNYLHDIQAYPVIVLDRSRLPILIEANIIEWIWHATAGSGYPGTGYEARFNVFIRKAIPSFWLPYGGDHAIDMHPYLPILQDRNYRLAGESMSIHHNTFISDAQNDPSVADAPDIKIRGIPSVLAEIYNNRFLNVNPSQAVSHYEGNVWVYNNLYGSAEKLIVVAEETTPQIIFRYPPPPYLEVPVLSGGNISVDMDVNVLEGLKLTEVLISLDNKIIYSSNSAPKTGDFSIPDSIIDSSLNIHKLTVTAFDDRNIKGEQTTFFKLN